MLKEYQLILKYPKDYPVGEGQEQLDSFNINDKDQVTKFVLEATAKIHPENTEGATVQDFLKTAMIVEGMLEDNFGTQIDEKSYREFAMDYVLENYKKSVNRHDLIIKGLVQNGLITL